MRYCVCLALVMLLGAAVVGYVTPIFGDAGFVVTGSAAAAEEKGKQSSGPPPLVIDKSAPLLLDEPPKENPLDASGGPVADNAACYCCHTNYEEEPLALQHAKKDIGCVDCHGKSFAHRNDEDNVTPPDIMYPGEKIASKCADCHRKHDAPAVEVIARWQQRCPTKKDPKEIVCTDCHGQHRLKLRTVRWDKKTGKLIIRGRQGPRKPIGDRHGQGNTASAMR